MSIIEIDLCQKLNENTIIESEGMNYGIQGLLYDMG